MPEVVRWLLANPQVWVIPAVLVSSVLGLVWALWWERRRPSSYTRRREFLEQVGVWRSMSSAAQAAHDEAVLDAAEAAARVEGSSVVVTAELIVAAEWARSIAER